MFNNNCLYVLAFSVLLVACGRNDLAPVDIKVDENGDIVGAEHLGPGEPTFDTTGPEASNPAVYVVREGETLFDIANKLSLDPMVLARVNGISYPYKVHPGQKLRIPGSAAAEEAAAVAPVVTADVSEAPEKEKSAAKDDEGKSNIDDDFSAMLAAVSGGAAAASTASKGGKSPKEESFNAQEEALSEPKIQPRTPPAEKKTSEAKKSEEKSSNKENKQVASSGWVAPVKGEIVSNYGDVVDGEANDGIDIKAALGTPVKAASGGEVIFSGEGNNLSPTFGKTVLISHGNNVVSSYTHLNSINVKNGEKVKAGQVIGTVGQTGDVTEPRLHFEITKGDDANSVNPSKYVKF